MSIDQARFKLEHHLMSKPKGSWLVKKIVCPDGYEISVQSGRGYYCTPDTDEGPWTHVECGCPSHKTPELMQYASDEDKPTETVYGWVPIEVIAKVLYRHGYVQDPESNSPYGANNGEVG